MKSLLILTVLACFSMSFAATDPCKLLAPGEVKSGLGSPSVTAIPDTGQDIPTCNFDFEDGGLSIGVVTGASKMLGGKSLLQTVQSGEGDGQSKLFSAIQGMGDEAVGFGAPIVTTMGTASISQDFASIWVRKGDTVLVFNAVSSDHAASKLNLPSLILLVKRALLRLP
ncbi:hypothetical protein [Deinococcus sp. UYEF24]